MELLEYFFINRSALLTSFSDVYNTIDMLPFHLSRINGKQLALSNLHIER